MHLNINACIQIDHCVAKLSILKFRSVHLKITLFKFFSYKKTLFKLFFILQVSNFCRLCFSYIMYFFLSPDFAGLDDGVVFCGILLNFCLVASQYLEAKPLYI